MIILFEGLKERLVRSSILYIRDILCKHVDMFRLTSLTPKKAYLLSVKILYYYIKVGFSQSYTKISDT